MTPIHTSIRPFEPDDEAAVAGVWHRAGQAAYTYLTTWQALTLDHARKVFREVIVPKCDLWVGTSNGRVVAYLAMNGPCIDRLYVDPDQWRKGWGTRLVALAKTLSPDGLTLQTHQANLAARELYEKHGFKPVKYGTSPPPESAPDVEYHWRPDNSPRQATVVVIPPSSVR
jgi:ribosomal protein S18 acetylase RimI-like enzyme